MENDPPEIDLDFLRYAEDIKESKSLKKFMEYNRYTYVYCDALQRRIEAKNARRRYASKNKIFFIFIQFHV